MKNKIILLRITYWWGIIADAVETIRMCSPKLLIATSGANIIPDAGFSFALSYGAPVMLGWTLLLFWADRKPLERKGVLICVIPVIVAYVIVEIFAVSNGIILLKNMIPVFILQLILLFLVISSYFNARNIG